MPENPEDSPFFRALLLGRDFEGYERVTETARLMTTHLIEQALPLTNKKYEALRPRQKATLHTVLKIISCTPYLFAPGNCLHTFFDYEVLEAQYLNKAEINYERSIISGAGVLFPEAWNIYRLNSKTGFGPDISALLNQIRESGLQTHLEQLANDESLNDILVNSIDILPNSCKFAHLGEPELELVLNRILSVTGKELDYTLLGLLPFAGEIGLNILGVNEGTLIRPNIMISGSTHQDLANIYAPGSFSFSSINRLDPESLLSIDGQAPVLSSGLMEILHGEDFINVVLGYMQFLRLTKSDGTAHLSLGFGRDRIEFYNRLMVMRFLRFLNESLHNPFAYMENIIPRNGPIPRDSPYYIFRKMHGIDQIKENITSMGSAAAILFQPNELAFLTRDQIMQILPSQLPKIHDEVTQTADAVFGKIDPPN